VAYERRGVEITREQAPRLWARIEEFAARIRTPPPTGLIGGIDDNFFVTEGDIDLEGGPKSGRTLYVGLGLLRILDRSEAEAVLCHELAHFRGGDTAHTLRLAPTQLRYESYVQTLHSNRICLPIYHLMSSFQQLFELAIAATRRQREVRADSVAADQTSPSAVAHALLKITAYSSWRAEFERGLFQQDDRLRELAIAQRVQAGFATFANSPRLQQSLAQSHVPHPLDSHPPNPERYAALRVSLPPESWNKVLLDRVASSWLDEIADSTEIEASLWERYEAKFRAAHEESLALRTTPRNLEERSLVASHYPPVSFVSKDGQVVVELTLAQLTLASWGEGVALEDIRDIRVDSRWDGKILRITIRGGIEAKLRLKTFAAPDQFVDASQKYLRRSRVAQQHGAGSPAPVK